MKTIPGKIQAFLSRRLSRWGDLPRPPAPGDGADGYKTYAVRLRGRRHFNIVIDPASADPIARAYRDGHHANDYLIALLTRFTRRGARVLDLGAHIGTFSLAAAALGRTVLAVDATRRHVDLLNRSIACNGHDRLRAVHAAVSDRPGTVRFLEASLWGMVAYPGLEAPLVEVEAVTVDRLLGQARWKRVDFVKMDVEGSEVAALKGMTRLLAREDAPVIVYECNGLTLAKYGLSPGELVGLLEGFGYTTYRAEAGGYRLYRSGDFQPESYLDVVALKPPHRRRVAGSIGPPLTAAEVCVRAVREAGMPHEVQREYIARALEHAGPGLLDDPSVRGALDRLADDPHGSVRLAAEWWTRLRSRAA